MKNFDIDTQHRSNSTYRILKSTDGYEVALMSWVDCFVKDDTITLDHFDFFVIRLIMDILEVFNKTARELLGTYYCTSHLFIYNICKIMSQFANIGIMICWV